MMKASVVALGIVMASGGLALAQQSSSDTGSQPTPPSQPGRHHAPPPPPAGQTLQGKGFDLELGHGRGLRVQCGDEPLKGCVQAVQPLIHQLRQANKSGTGKGRHHGKHPVSPGGAAPNHAKPYGSMKQKPDAAQGDNSRADTGADSGSNAAPTDDTGGTQMQ